MGLKAKANTRRKVGQVSACAGLMQNGTGTEISQKQLQFYVALQVPLRLNSGLVAYISRPGRFGRAYDLVGYSIEAITAAGPPKEKPFHANAQDRVAGGVHGQNGVQVNQIGRPDLGYLAKVSTSGKQGIKKRKKPVASE